MIPSQGQQFTNVEIFCFCFFRDKEKSKDFIRLELHVLINSLLQVNIADEKSFIFLIDFFVLINNDDGYSR